MGERRFQAAGICCTTNRVLSCEQGKGGMKGPPFRL
nr:MAG TPA: hypothetical protein [Caudoviricetes sp.]